MASSNKPASLEGYIVDETGKQRQLTKSPSNTVLGYIGYPENMVCSLMEFLPVHNGLSNLPSVVSVRMRRFRGLMESPKVRETVFR